jgi:hypothetical protein
VIVMFKDGRHEPRPKETRKSNSEVVTAKHK